MTRTVRTVLACAIAALVIPATGHAQIKSLIKKKAAAQVMGEEKQAKADGLQAPKFGGNLVELAGPALDDFMAAHALENRLIREFRQQLTRYKSADEVRACEEKVAMTPEAQKIAMQIANLPENAKIEDVQKVTEKMGREMLALIKSKCGESVDAIWPQYKRSEQIASFRRLAALAFDSALDARAAAPPRGGPMVEEPSWLMKEPTPKYPLAEERILAFCRLKDANKLTRDERGFYFGTGDSPGMYYIYSDDEYNDMSKKCKQLEHEEEVG